MTTPFDTITIKNMKLPNRFVRSATWEAMATDGGAVTPKLIRTMKELAEGGIGMIVSGHAYILPEGQAGPWQMGIHDDNLIDGLREMTSAVHDAGGKIIAQLAHAGTQASEKLTGHAPMAVSVFDGLADSPRVEITAAYIEKLTAAFADAAARAKTAGFDGVQIHSAHGYLLSQFLSPYYNRREDAYGGTIENRARVHREVLKAIRSAVGDDYPVLVKLNSRDFTDEGLSLEDSLFAAKMLEQGGLDAIEVSGGVLTGSGKSLPSRTGITAEEKEAYFADEARQFKGAVDIPLILVGGMRSYTVVESVIESGVADMVSLARPLIREPDLVKRWKAGDTRKAECNSDNLCFGPALKGEGIYCVSREREQQKE
ncbi:MAG: NADH:flavin oxidoreductase [Thermodesulfobacteriota bacterium]